MEPLVSVFFILVNLSDFVYPLHIMDTMERKLKPDLIIY